ncbi:MAG: ribosome silencing factor [Candidatus Omnitrophica bacterium]|nr:ribosome silencing factor [Candidatus Omnitrophota bacterium]
MVMDLRGCSGITDYFVLCTAGSSRQVQALTDHLEETLRRNRCPVWHAEGASARPQPGAWAEGRQWVLVDCGDVVVHLFDKAARSFYSLERLWADAPRVAVQEEHDRIARTTTHAGPSTESRRPRR